MGHVTGQVVSSETVSLSLVSSIFKRFLSADNGTSAEVFACLKRSSAAVDELIQVKSKGGAEGDQCTGHETLEKKASRDGHGGSESKKQLGLEGDIVDAKRGSKSDKLGKVVWREHAGHQQSVDGDKRPRSKHSQSEVVGLDDPMKGHRHKKREKNLESLDGSHQPDSLGRDSGKEQKEREDEAPENERGEKHKMRHKVHHVMDHNMPTNELEKELRQKHVKEPSKRDNRYQQVQEVAQFGDPTAGIVNGETEKKKKRKKEIGEGEDGGQENELHRDKKKRRK
ncbi:uncharacterized protein LOC116249513 [Nymphaea colorata]|uniref:uncharacterized protein LOC116249513 n=1 Tax=Nymphaea colorata TaxID=210225 RepID=UPI00129D5492|nr:uncharacterized protein LOC116249513 [Nymphaea colorata]XP_031478681.1 uncharacterized protein LOC116249513 [Nymphaea colorata]XP_031478764.1 uncharacterized protein LOC116249513 [Nymphaea colorata]XP_031478848.1 uncharacterized protein LOC116249513 [Nymphaea colorata]XP_031478917.1 uncharacterized protein LOC116249513 [Nymphaea colorata]XP_049931626.1 uncharacterized protein LOC116249513 [Nymphaea colorata]